MYFRILAFELINLASFPARPRKMTGKQPLHQRPKLSGQP